VEPMKKKKGNQTIAGKAWDLLNEQEQQLALTQAKNLIAYDTKLCTLKKAVEELIRKINTTNRPLTDEEIKTFTNRYQTLFLGL
jgi:hypothetical protein